MREHIQATLRIDFDADAALSIEEQTEAIRSELIARLCNRPSVLPVEATQIEILSVKSEAEIYGNA